MPEQARQVKLRSSVAAKLSPRRRGEEWARGHFVGTDLSCQRPSSDWGIRQKLPNQNRPTLAASLMPLSPAPAARCSYLLPYRLPDIPILALFFFAPPTPYAIDYDSKGLNSIDRRN